MFPSKSLNWKFQNNLVNHDRAFLILVAMLILLLKITDKRQNLPPIVDVRANVSYKNLFYMVYKIVTTNFAVWKFWQSPSNVPLFIYFQNKIELKFCAWNEHGKKQGIILLLKEWLTEKILYIYPNCRPPLLRVWQVPSFSIAGSFLQYRRILHSISQVPSCLTGTVIGNGRLSPKIFKS